MTPTQLSMDRTCLGDKKISQIDICEILSFRNGPWYPLCPGPAIPVEVVNAYLYELVRLPGACFNTNYRPVPDSLKYLYTYNGVAEIELKIEWMSIGDVLRKFNLDIPMDTSVTEVTDIISGLGYLFVDIEGTYGYPNARRMLTKFVWDYAKLSRVEFEIGTPETISYASYRWTSTPELCWTDLHRYRFLNPMYNQTEWAGVLRDFIVEQARRGVQGLRILDGSLERFEFNANLPDLVPGLKSRYNCRVIYCPGRINRVEYRLDPTPTVPDGISDKLISSWLPEEVISKWKENSFIDFEKGVMVLPANRTKPYNADFDGPIQKNLIIDPVSADFDD